MPKRNWIEFNQSNLNNQPKSPKQAHSVSNQQIKVEKVKNSKGGKVVTVITGLALEDPQAAKLLKRIKSSLGTGGTIKTNSMEIQGNKVKEVLEILEQAGYRLKRANG